MLSAVHAWKAFNNLQQNSHKNLLKNYRNILYEIKIITTKHFLSPYKTRGKDGVGNCQINQENKGNKIIDNIHIT